MKTSRIAILYSLIKDDKENYYGNISAVNNALCSLGYNVRKIPIGIDIKKNILDIKKYSPLYIFNLCEEVDGHSWGEMYIAGILELLNIPYTGSGPFSLGLSLDKAKSKDVLLNNGIKVPKYWVFDTANKKIPKDVELYSYMSKTSATSRRNVGIKFPLIVKPIYEDGSYGIEAESIVWNKNTLCERISLINKRFRQPAIAEEYIEGRELNISILGNGKNIKILPISEINYSKMPKKLPKICTYNAKWKEKSDEYKWSISVFPADLPKRVKTIIEDTAVKVYNIMQCRDYARIDIRLDKNKIPYIIDINPNPCLSLDSGFVRSAGAAGLSYEKLIGEIVNSCKKRIIS